MSSLTQHNPSHIATTRRIAALLPLVLFGVACAPDASTAPHMASARQPNPEVGSLDRIYTLQLRAIPTDPILPPNPIYGFGHLTLRSGATLGDACVPPNPITPAPGSTLLTVCGTIFNEGGALYRGGGIYTVPSGLGGDGSIFIAAFGGTTVNDACRRYDIAGAVTVSDAIAADMMVNPGGYQVLMDGDVASAPTRIGGRFDGSAWGPVGSRPETDPFFTAKVCGVTVTP